MKQSIHTHTHTNAHIPIYTHSNIRVCVGTHTHHTNRNYTMCTRVCEWAGNNIICFRNVCRGGRRGHYTYIRI